MSNFRYKKKCVLCESKNLTNVVEFPDTPIANKLKKKEFDEEEVSYPLILSICEDCKHIQLKSIVNSELLFDDYPYRSNSNQTTSSRLIQLSAEIEDSLGDVELKTLIEIGSNDGFLMKQMQKFDWQVLGIDPAIEASKIAQMQGMKIIVDFFGLELARQLKEDNGEVSLIIANNVLAHSNELRSIFRGIYELLSDDGTLIMEFSYALDILNSLLFDTIYHEHTSYHSLISLIPFLFEFKLEPVKAVRFNAHGGSLRLYVKKIETKTVIDDSIGNLIELESNSGIDKVSSWKDFESRISYLRISINKLLIDIKNENLSIVGYGVPAKFATLFHVLSLDQNQFSYLVDDNEEKQNNFGPGTKLRIFSPEILKNDPPDYIFIFSWNYSEEIIRKIQSNKLAKVGIICPLPSFSVTRI